MFEEASTWFFNGAGGSHPAMGRASSTNVAASIPQVRNAAAPQSLYQVAKGPSTDGGSTDC